eukprot:NODE_1568_length_2434_cov_17.948418.p1 GENE.NODE_1568_length_2434_cov_17.948418~~NODE_1568_length_2434_cov_17.948418.p1  ORF type:complete len:353 (-),score=55.45 NODE_1568_length_2434_cov_17.948418:172-1230(-)
MQNSNVANYIMSTPKRSGEPWNEAAARCIDEHLRITPLMAKGILERRSTKDHPSYLFLEEAAIANTSYPAVKSHYWWHLVTYVVKDENKLPELGLSFPDENKAPSFLRAFRGHHRNIPTGMDLEAAVRSPAPAAQCAADHVAHLRRCGSSESYNSDPEQLYTRCLGCHWVDEVSVKLARGAYLWEKACAHCNINRVQSVLLGLEGCRPTMTTPFGMKHDAHAKSSKLSALGCRKWRAFRANGAIEVPADNDGLHMKVTERAFKELQEVCEKLALLDAQLDLLTIDGAPLARDLLNQRYAEATLFKQVLGGSAKQARKAIECFVAHRELEPALHHSSPTSSAWIGEAELYASI